MSRNSDRGTLLHGFRSYNAKGLAQRGLDFAHAATVFAGVTVEVEDMWR